MAIVRGFLDLDERVDLEELYMRRVLSLPARIAVHMDADTDRLTARELTRESRASFGNIRFRGEAANLVAIGFLTLAAMIGSAVIVVAAGFAVVLSRPPAPALREGLIATTALAQT